MPTLPTIGPAGGPSERTIDAWAAHHGRPRCVGDRTRPASRHAHDASTATRHAAPTLDRLAREELEDRLLAPGATRAVGAGDRAGPRPPDPERTCFERDRDRILHATAFRRLAGKTQVFVFPDDHQRTRLTHALEVAQVATAIARAIGLNVALTEAIALGHDCGHGPGGHASEDAFSPFVAGGLRPRRLGRRHGARAAQPVRRRPSTASATTPGRARRRRPRRARSSPGPTGSPTSATTSRTPSTPASCRPTTSPPSVRERCGDRRSRQLHAFIDGVVDAVARDRHHRHDRADGRGARRASAAFNYERIYMRPDVGRAVRVGHRGAPGAGRALRRASVGHAPGGSGRRATPPGCPAALREAVTYVGGMTDRYAFARPSDLLGWRPEDLPVGIA